MTCCLVESCDTAPINPLRQGHGISTMHDGLGWATGSPAGRSRPVRPSMRNTAMLSPGMFALHEAAMCRRRAAGDQPWNWNAGLASPVLTKAAGCR